MQGIYINGRRPKSKKEIKERVKLGLLEDVMIEATSLFSDEFGGTLDCMGDRVVYFCGPDPHTNRKFYGTIKKVGEKVTVE